MALGAQGFELNYVPESADIIWASKLVDHGEDPMSGFHFCLETDEFDAAVARLTADGVEVERAPHDTAARAPREQGWRRVVFRGPDGESIELRG